MLWHFANNAGHQSAARWRLSGGNTAEGQNALLSLNTGGFNTAVGFLSLRSNIIGGFNTGIGAGTLLANTADQNTATGAGALLSNTTGGFNTAHGAFALFSNTTGFSNTAIGNAALVNNNLGRRNTAIGAGTLSSNGFADNNTAIGADALSANGIGDRNTATGDSALASNFAGNDNTANGYQALLSNTGGGGNTAVGSGALINSTGDGNTALGGGAGSGVTTATNVICIGVIGGNVNASCFIGNIRGATTAVNNAIPVLIDSAGQLGTMSSSRRFKKAIQPMDKTSEAILALKPVTFHYNSDKTNRPEFGLIAEEVADVNPDLVVRDKNGEIYTVRYDAVNAMLLNEFLKEHKAVQVQGATITRLQKQIDALTAGLQKVSDRLEASKPAPQVVNNP